MAKKLRLWIKNSTPHLVVLDAGSAGATACIKPGDEAKFEVSGSGWANYKIPVAGRADEYFGFSLRPGETNEIPYLEVSWLGPSVRWNGKSDVSDPNKKSRALETLSFVTSDIWDGDLYSLSVSITWVEQPKLVATPPPPPPPKPKPTPPPVIVSTPVVTVGTINTSAVPDLLTVAPADDFDVEPDAARRKALEADGDDSEFDKNTAAIADLEAKRPRLDADAKSAQAALDKVKRSVPAASADDLKGATDTRDVAVRLRDENKTALDAARKTRATKWSGQRALEAAMVKKRWVYVAGKAVTNGQAREPFFAALHAGLKAAYVLLKAASPDQFWSRAGIDSVLFFRRGAGHHGYGCAVDLSGGKNPYVPIGHKGAMLSEDATANVTEWTPFFKRVFDIYARAALFTGLVSSFDEKVMRLAAGAGEAARVEQVIRFLHVHQSLRAYFALGYAVDFNGYQPRVYTHALRLPPDSITEDVADVSVPPPIAGAPKPPPPVVAEKMGHCSSYLDDKIALDRIKNPSQIAYPWCDPGTLEPELAPRKGTSDGVDRLRSTLGLDTDATDQQLLEQIRRDHELFRLAIVGGRGSYSVPSPKDPDLQKDVRSGRLLYVGHPVTRDPCNGFFWYHPYVPIALSNPSLRIRCLGFSSGTSWGIAGTEGGDIMHFDFEGDGH